MSGYIGTKAVLLSTTAASVTGNADIGGNLTVDTSTLFVDSTNNRVGVGTVAPIAQLEASEGFTARGIAVPTNTSVGSVQLGFDGTNGVLRTWNSSPISYETYGVHKFLTSGTERMRIDASGNLLVGTTSADPITVNTDGISLGSDKIYRSTVTGGPPIAVNRKGSDGSIISLHKDGTTVGSIGVTAGDNLYLQGSSGHAGLESTNLGLNPWEGGSTKDNLYDLGHPSARWDDIYATNGTIQTSDRNEKQDITEMDEAERRVAVAVKGLIRKFRWKDAVAEKGDDARIHFGIIAQDLQAAFEAEGLDAGRYAMFISSTWWEADRVIPAVEAQDAVYETQLDEDGNEVQVLVSEAVEAQPEQVVTDTYETQAEAPEGAVERTRLGVRYPELLAFIIGAM